MKYIFLICLLTCNYLSGFSQRSGLMESPYGMTIDFQPGYYYTYTNTKVKGLISVDCACIYFKPAMGEKRVILTPKDIKSYVVGIDSFTILNKFYSADETYYNEAFVLVVKKGILNLYSHCDHPDTVHKNAAGGLSNGESINAVSTYYIEKNNTLYRLKRSDFKDRANYIFGDNLELIEKINQKQLGFNDIEQIVAEYNAWYEKKNAVVAPEK